MALKWMLTVVAVLASVASTQAQQQQTMTAAELFDKYYRAGKTWKITTAYWIDGFINGVAVTSVYAEYQQGGKPIICAPDVVIGHEFVIQNMERLVKEQPDLVKEIWPIVALTALREAFPCK